MIQRLIGAVVLTAALVAAGMLAVPFAGAGRAADVMPSTQDGEHFNASFRGNFTLTAGTGPDGTDEMRYRGTGSGSHFDQASEQGYALLRPLPRSHCSELVSDKVTITTADGSTLEFATNAVDCVQLGDAATIIHNGGTYQITGGTGRFEGASGNGTIYAEASVTNSANGGLTGTYEQNLRGELTFPTGA